MNSTNSLRIETSIQSNNSITHTTATRTTDVLNTPNPERMVIIVCWPPHSGKSVFFHTLKEMLPDHMTYGIRACPDGEGDWSQLGDGEVVQGIRKKWIFDEKTMLWYRQSIENSKNIPLTFVDVGGKISTENEKIFKLGTHCIVLCRSDKPEEKKKWEVFAKENHLTLLASLNSSLSGSEWEIQEDAEGTILWSVVWLERWSNVSSLTIDALAKRILSIAPYKPLWNDVLKEEDWYYILDMSVLAKEVGLLSKKITIHDQKTGTEKMVTSKIWWSHEVTRLTSILSKLPFSRTKPLVLNGIAPAFVYTRIISAVPNDHIFIADPKVLWGKIDISSQTEDTTTSMLLNYNSILDEEKTILTIDIPGGIFDMQKISEITLPQVPFDKWLIISGRLPIALSAKIVNYYRWKVPFIALFTPQQVEDSKMKEPCMIVYWENIGKYISLSQRL
ncbi:MAG: hypothetical protein ACD_78C00422G0004 [uncultured bacterium (gcode 4)]|uniref:Uncharacterized protein n=1 Tax=uncultured bacterium (gcode 4) TaxID=1234023 RepID=K1XWR1_9BACT|nr:MAG: hypothetical protein ACD_78C00422G0004 [uncultured bacterium (gcode 4)]